MAKLTLDPIGNFTSGTVTTINTNMDRIEAALEKTLSRDGTTPNQMTADLDMNNQDILNVQMMSVDTLEVDNLVYEEIDFETIVSEMTVLKDETVSNAASAESARIAAEAAASSVLLVEFATVAAAQAYTPLIAPDFIRTAFYDSNQFNRSGALYKKVVAEPTHAGKFSITLSGGGSPVWYEIAEDVISPTMIGVQMNAVTSQTVAFQNFANIPIDSWYIPQGTIRLDSSVTRTGRDTTIRGKGTFDFNNGNGGLILQGTADLIPNLSVNVSKFGRTLTLTDASVVSPLDLLCLFNPTDYSWTGHRYYYRDGDMFRVHSKIGNVITRYGQFCDSYLVADMEVYKINGVNIDIDEVTFISSATSPTQAPLRIDFGDGVRIGANVRGHGGVYTVLDISRSYDVVIAGASVENNSPVDGDEYGIILSNVQNFIVNTGSTASRHPVALGGSTGPCCVPTRNGRIHNSILLSGLGENGGAADMHGNCDKVTYNNCIIDSMAVFGGRDGTWTNNLIYGTDHAAGITMFGSEIAGGIYTISGNRIISNGNGTSFGYIHLVAFGPSNTPTGLEGLREDLTVIADDNTFDVTGGASAMVFKMVNRSATWKVNVQIGRTTILRATQISGILDVQDDTNPAMNSNFLIVDGPIIAPSGTSLMIPRASIPNVPTRQMTQHVVANAECTLGQTQATTGTLNFRYVYSKKPECFGTAFTPTDGTTKSIYGGKGVASGCNAVAAGTARIQARSTTETAFTSTENIRLSGSFGIREI